MKINYQSGSSYLVFFSSENPSLIRRPVGKGIVEVSLNDGVIEYSTVSQKTERLGIVSDLEGEAIITWQKQMSVDSTFSFIQANAAITEIINKEAGDTFTVKLDEWYTRNYNESEQRIVETLVRLFEFYFPTLAYPNAKSIIHEIMEAHPISEIALGAFKVGLLEASNKSLDYWKYSFVTNSVGVVRRYTSTDSNLPDRQLKEGDVVLEISKTMHPGNKIMIDGLSLYKYSEPK